MVAASHAGKLCHGHMTGHALAACAVHIMVRVVRDALPFHDDTAGKPHSDSSHS
jgi:hypothetical protein